MKKLVNISFIFFLALAFAMVGCKKMEIAPESDVDMEIPTKKKVVSDEESDVFDNLKDARSLDRGNPFDGSGVDWDEMDSVNDDDDAEEDDEQQTLVSN